MKIYIDILIISNCILTLVYLRTFEKVTHRSISNGRLAISSIAGGLFSLIIAADGGSYAEAVVITLIKWGGIVITLALAVKFSGAGDFFKSFIIYIVIRIGYTGVIFLYWQISDSKRIYVRNYTTYFDISLFTLLAAVITAYALLSVYEFIVRRFHSKTVSYKAVYRNGNYILNLPAVADSGNKLCDSFTGTPVVIFCCNEMFYHYELDNLEMCKNGGFRFVPYNTINGGGLAAVTPKGQVTIIDDSGKQKDVRCCVGVVKSENGKSRAIFNPALIE